MRPPTTKRLDQTEAALATGSRAAATELSHAVFGSELPPIQRRFAVAEALSHLERLVELGRAPARRGRPKRDLYCAAAWWTSIPRSSDALGAGDRVDTLLRARRRCSSDPAKRAVRGSGVRPRDGQAHADRRAPPPGQPPRPRRAADHERSAAVHRGDAARRHGHLDRHRRARRARALEEAFDPYLASRPSSRSRSPTCCSPSCTSCSVSSCRRALRWDTRREPRSHLPRPCAPSSPVFAPFVWVLPPLHRVRAPGLRARAARRRGRRDVRGRAPDAAHALDRAG